MNVYVNGQPREVAGSATVAEVIGATGESSRGIAVAVDGTVVPRARHATTLLHDGARIEIVTAVQGG
ncbi:MAG TPA: sulfur carrier protein ThiS [Microlunatus sp.]|nr:sulfur carrier protein ThiS [Microlunatus sp.]